MIDVAATIANLEDAGFTAEDIVRALKCISPEHKRTPGAIRQERYRLAHKAVTSDVTVTPDAVVKESPQTPKENQEPSKEKPPKGGQKKVPTRLPEDWTLPAEWATWAIQRGLPPQRVSIEADKLRNWAANAGSKGAKVDWFRAWQNWVIGAIDKLPNARAGPGGRETGSTWLENLANGLEAANGHGGTGTAIADHLDIAGSIPGHARRIG